MKKKPLTSWQLRQKRRRVAQAREIGAREIGARRFAAEVPAPSAVTSADMFLAAMPLLAKLIRSTIKGKKV